MSPVSRCGTRLAMVLSTTAAGTINHIARGLSSFFTNSGSVAEPTAFSCTSSFTAFGDMSKTTQRWPLLSRRRTMFAPILPRPIIPSCIEHSLSLTVFYAAKLCSLRRSMAARNRSIAAPTPSLSPKIADPATSKFASARSANGGAVVTSIHRPERTRELRVGDNSSPFAECLDALHGGMQIHVSVKVDEKRIKACRHEFFEEKIRRLFGGSDLGSLLRTQRP